MLKFFRRIRQNLLTQNRFSKYFLYALGEIVLVVFGILIALQINNWNENRKKEEKETQILISFKNDLIYNINELEDITKNTEFTYKSADSILQMSYVNIQNPRERFLSDHILSSSTLFSYKTQEGTIQDVLGSGNLGIITNDSIRLAIAAWETSLKSIREWEILDLRSVGLFTEYIKQHIHIDNILSNKVKIPEETNSQLLKDLVFLNHVTDRKIIPDALNRLYRNEQTRLEQLIEAIENALNQ